MTDKMTPASAGRYIFAPKKFGKSSLILLTTLAVIFANLSLFGQDEALADVAALNVFTATPTQTATTGDPVAANFTVSAGNDRMLVVAVDTYDSAGAAGLTVSATYGGTALTMAVNENSNRRHSWIGYLAIGSSGTATTSPLAVTVTGTHTNVAVWAGSFSGVHQTSPTGGAGSIYDNNTTATPQFPIAASVSSGGYGVYTWSANVTRTSDSETYTEHGEVLAGVNTGVASLAFATAGNTQPTVTFSGTARASMCLVTFNPAPAGAPASITVNPTSGLTTTEAGAAASFTVVLDSAPSANVTIGISSSDTTEGTVSPSSVTFTTGNWNSPQAVTITGVDDAILDGSIAYTVLTAAATSSDGNYGGLNASDVSVTNTDNEVQPPGVPAGNLFLFGALFSGIALYGLRWSRNKRAE